MLLKQNRSKLQRIILDREEINNLKKVGIHKIQFLDDKGKEGATQKTQRGKFKIKSKNITMTYDIKERAQYS